ncbi:hypothetical protein DN540_40985, partial [Burkholderia multivorans]
LIARMFCGSRDVSPSLRREIATGNEYASDVMSFLQASAPELTIRLVSDILSGFGEEGDGVGASVTGTSTDSGTAAPWLRCSVINLHLDHDVLDFGPRLVGQRGACQHHFIVKLFEFIVGRELQRIGV